jgi:hypothetical protein
VTETSGAPTLERADRSDSDATFIRIRLSPALSVDGPAAFFAGHRLSGFASWTWNGSELRAETDRFGLYPLFYCHDGHSIALSTSLSALMPFLRSRDWDLEALGVFLRLGYFISDDTPFREIRVAPPSLTWRAGQLSAPRPLPEPAEAVSLPRAEVEREYGRLFAESIRARINGGRTFVPLSGGRDSRHIFLELLRSGARLEAAVTMASTRTNDAEVAASLCLRAGVRHAFVPPTVFALDAALERNLETSFGTDEHLWAGKVRDWLREERADTIFDGIAGDVLSQSKNLTRARLDWMRRGLLSEMASDLTANEDRFLRGVLSREFYASIPLASANAKIAAELAIHQRQPNPVGSFFFWNRMRREIALAPFGILRSFTAHVPFLDPPLYGFLTSLSGEFLLEHRLHDDVIRREYPGFADIPYSQPKSGGKRLGPNSQELVRLLRYAARSGKESRSTLIRLARALVDVTYRHNVEAIAKWPVYLQQLSEL